MHLRIKHVEDGRDFLVNARSFEKQDCHGLALLRLFHRRGSLAEEFLQRLSWKNMLMERKQVVNRVPGVTIAGRFGTPRIVYLGSRFHGRFRDMSDCFSEHERLF